MSDEDRIRDMVRRVVYRAVGALETAETPGPASGGRLVTQKDIQNAPIGGKLRVPAGALVTPLARQTAIERRVSLVHDGESRGASPTRLAAPAATPSATVPSGAARSQDSKGKFAVAIAADHGGFEMKQQIAKTLASLGHEVIDCGTGSKDPVDYPDYALAAAQLVSQGRAWRAIIVDGAGIGSCMAANKVPGVRAAMCYDQATAVNSRAHNDANVLTLGAGLIGTDLARQIVGAWLETAAGGDRHARRVNKIMDIERRFSRGIADEV